MSIHSTNLQNLSYFFYKIIIKKLFDHLKLLKLLKLLIHLIRICI